MPFEIRDFHRHYTKLGDIRGLFNACRADEGGGEEFWGYQNEAGSYIITRATTSGTVKIYNYYAVGGQKAATQFQTDWNGRAGLSYVEYEALFPEKT